MGKNKTGTEDGSSLEFDYVIVGSGFGGSVSALRLAQKGYSVAIIESGKRWRGEDFGKSNWNLRKYMWFPKIGCHGILRMNWLKDIFIVSGAGVGGGSLVYANTLYKPPQKFFDLPIVKELGGEPFMDEFYKIARRMLGVTENPRLWEIDELFKDVGRELNPDAVFNATPVGVYFGDSSKKNPDPFFNGEGPERIGCNDCGGCMVGCRFDAKNTLDKNYLYFAEKLGVRIFPEHKVVQLNPLSEDGEEGYELRTKSTTSFMGRGGLTFRAKNVVLSAGVLGTINLLLKMKEEGRMERLSDSLGDFTRTNSEAILGVSSRDSHVDYTKGVAITSSIYVDEHTHMEPVRYPRGSDAMHMLATLLTDGGGLLPRWMKWMGNIIKHPIDFLRSLNPWNQAYRSIIILVMQTLDSSIKLVRKRRLIWPFTRSLTNVRKEGKHIPTYIPIAQTFARILGKKINGIPASSVNEVFFDMPTTAHILGGACIAESPTEGVIDLQNNVFGYKNLYVCDGSMIPGNLGVNPSLSIAAFTERAMSFIPPKSGKMKLFKFEESWKITGVLEGKSKNALLARYKNQ